MTVINEDYVEQLSLFIGFTEKCCVAELMVTIIKLGCALE